MLSPWNPRPKMPQIPNHRMGNFSIHNTSATRALMAKLYDPQFSNVTDIDCFSQAIFKSLDDYKRMKQDPWYKEKLMGDHENFADTKRSMMTIGWVEDFVKDRVETDSFTG
ncbi:hypothetical protein MGYG_08240 [Nannizzia gypsea CBS 118893]|uniref:EthD domain-containing protein n=1 Tax=Arthroderma gypseum (strain ATCC MYA-4604 / CBS 118893) TaxID=535722 RepID=E4V645_ARTGP|nr:hypothetical protein MGYG_08240 [Nannizzia gypsea CBS 118893]EFR05228.1 hypothetical protein MGYG_08240 [Nannizzia gypsea CBS 118893]